MITGGWSVTSDYAPEGTGCLVADQGILIAHNDNPLTPDQMRALAELLIFSADRLEEGTL